MQAMRMKEVNLMTARHLWGFHDVAVPDEYKMYSSRTEAGRKHSKKLKLGEHLPAFF